MKPGSWFYLLSVTGLVLNINSSCEKDVPFTRPEISTVPLSNVSFTSAVSGGNITSDGGSTITERGVCWSTKFNPTISDNYTVDGEGTGSFSSSVKGLTGGTTYYLRAYATNSAGTAYGNEYFFYTPITDVEGNIYNILIIGNQIWMKENLKTRKYNDSQPIAFVTDYITWNTLSTPAYCWYKNDEASYKDSYGALYNWFAVNTGKLCPVGWHVPDEADWMTLADYVGGESIAGSKLKERGYIHWYSPNLDASNDFGFTAMAGGFRSGLNLGSFRAMGFRGFWWAGTESDPDRARARLMTFDESALARGAGIKKNGYSVRCLKD
jgi:uncharacterized protein (TIGR02145 family)